ncbi:EXLDI protein [Actinoplanes sp. NBRC 103695]|uniref:EXLDI protein n=1 Tax=Actinoplanes sp. NBRC 103695 TaxID=3032202 RepID=UPI00255529D3|nr:EXLDI protein [Actinoplanes sp. NBRC 103695]
MPNKTIYVSDDDLPLYQRAQDLAGGKLSAAIATALRRYVEFEEGRQLGYAEIVVRVGQGLGRKQRFSGVLLAELERSGNGGTETYRVYRTRSENFAVHVEQSEMHVNHGPNSEKWNTGWRAWIGDWSANQTWSRTPATSALHVAVTLDDLHALVPQELYDLVVDLTGQPDVEDLDI